MIFIHCRTPLQLTWTKYPKQGHEKKSCLFVQVWPTLILEMWKKGVFLLLFLFFYFTVQKNTDPNFEKALKFFLFLICSFCILRCEKDGVSEDCIKTLYLYYNEPGYILTLKWSCLWYFEHLNKYNCIHIKQSFLLMIKKNLWTKWTNNYYYYYFIFYFFIFYLFIYLFFCLMVQWITKLSAKTRGDKA